MERTSTGDRFAEKSKNRFAEDLPSGICVLSQAVYILVERRTSPDEFYAQFLLCNTDVAFLEDFCSNDADELARKALQRSNNLSTDRLDDFMCPLDVVFSDANLL